MVSDLPVSAQREDTLLSDQTSAQRGVLLRVDYSALLSSGFINIMCDRAAGIFSATSLMFVLYKIIIFLNSPLRARCCEDLQ